MRTPTTTFAAVVGLGSLMALFAGCNTDLNNSSGSTRYQSATGIWSGSDSVSGLGVTAIINSGGDAAFIRSDGVLFTGTVQVSGSALAVTVDGYTVFGGAAFSDGSTSGLGTLNGTVTSAATITASLTFTTADSTAITGNWSLTYELVSNNASSPAAAAGNYTDTVTGAVLSINSNGVMTSQSANNGCVLNGTLSTSDTAHDVYEVAYTFGACTGNYTVLNDVQFTGLAFLNASSPAQLTLAVTGTSTTTTKYAVVSTLNGS
jgi:hypothetical protein